MFWHKGKNVCENKSSISLVFFLLKDGITNQELINFRGRD